jgi:hypothetical protein
MDASPYAVFDWLFYFAAARLLETDWKRHMKKRMESDTCVKTSAAGSEIPKETAIRIRMILTRAATAVKTVFIETSSIYVCFCVVPSEQYQV